MQAHIFYLDKAIYKTQIFTLKLSVAACLLSYYK